MPTTVRQILLLLCFVICCRPVAIADEIIGEPWVRHTIDDSSRGADGVRTGDINRDGLPDLCTGWEEGGVIRVYLNPGPASTRDRWPAVTVGQVRSPEDAVFADVNGDGVLDVVSSCEGRTRTMFVHRAPHNVSSLMDSSAWKTAEIPATAGAQSWMFCLPLPVDGNVELFAGSKGGGARISRLAINGRDLAGWRLEPHYEAGWIMSLIAEDMDDDGDDDILFSDRKGPTRGCKWLENTGLTLEARWPVHVIGATDHEVMFLACGDVDRNGSRDIVAATRDNGVLLFYRNSPGGNDGTQNSIPMPSNTGTGKAVAVSDLDSDGNADLVVSCENANNATGLFWLQQQPTGETPAWLPREISGRDEGVKFDRLELLDLDGDGDDDIITCEERDNLGVIWYENPSR